MNRRAAKQTALDILREVDVYAPWGRSAGVPGVTLEHAGTREARFTLGRRGLGFLSRTAGSRMTINTNNQTNANGLGADSEEDLLAEDENDGELTFLEITKLIALDIVTVSWFPFSNEWRILFSMLFKPHIRPLPCLGAY